MTDSSGQSLDPLIGRDADLEHLLDVLERERLVTLTGPGGIGKTRLARAALQALRDDRQAWFVDCSAMEDIDLLGASIAAALGLKSAQGEDVARMIEAVTRGRAALLILDNLEQLPGVGVPIAEILEAVAELSILATSRIALGARGERELPVTPLALPIDDSRDALLASPAGQLFLRRTGEKGLGEPIEESTASAIAKVLRRVDGMPLGIELAAARSRVLSPEEINRRLDARGPDAIDERGEGRRSMRAVIDWTVGQMASQDVAVLEALSVCAGFDLALAEAITSETDALAAIETLVALGLVQRLPEVNAVSRFRLLVVIQEAVLRRIPPDRLSALQGLHAEQMLIVAARWHKAATTLEARGLAAEYVVDADNIRRALDHLELADPPRAVVLIARLEDFWASHGRGREGYQRLLALEERVPPSIELARARLAFFDVGRFLLSNREHRALLAGALELARRFEDPDTIEEALQYSAIAATYPGDHDAIRQIAAEMESIARPDDPESFIRLLDVRSTVAWIDGNRGSPEYMALLEQLIEALRAAGRERWVRLTGDLAFARLSRGDNLEAIRLASRAADALIEHGREADASWALAVLPPALSALGRVDEAVEAAIRCANMAARTGAYESVADALYSAMPVGLAIGLPLLTARHFGTIDAMVDRGQTMWGASDGEFARQWMARARRAASQVEIELAVEEGRRADPFDVLAALPDVLRGTSRPSKGTAPSLRHGDLTRREVEILRLIGLGRSDPEIAAELFISPKTASVHVSNIKGKLGAESRLQVALRAREMGLVAGEEPTQA